MSADYLKIESVFVPVSLGIVHNIDVARKPCQFLSVVDVRPIAPPALALPIPDETVIGEPGNAVPKNQNVHDQVPAVSSK